MLRGSFIVALALCSFGLAPCRGQDTYQEEADRLSTMLNWKLGSVVAEIGAGNGRLTLAAVQRVGPLGRVYATELDAKALAHLEELAAKEKNITAIKAAEADTNLPPGSFEGLAVFGSPIGHASTAAWRSFRFSGQSSKN
jgi:predicted RNA methylase